MRLFTQWSRFLAVLVALTFVAAAGRGAVLAQGDADSAGPAGQPPLGAAVPFIDEQGNEAATVTVTDYVDPFEGYDPSSPPERGFRFVEVGLQVDNIGRRPFPFAGFSIYLQDTEGFLYSPTFLFRPAEATEERPDYTSEDVPGGDSLAGYLYFAVFNDAEIVRIVYTDGFERLIFLADLTVEPLIEVGGDGGATPETETEDATEEATEEPDSGGDGATIDLSEEECADVTSWYEEAETRFAGLEASFAILGEEDPDPDALRELADEVSALAEEQADTDVPEAAQAANDAGVALFQAFADAVSEYADAVESGEASPEDITTIFAAIQGVATEFDTLINELAAACGIEVE